MGCQKLLVLKVAMVVVVATMVSTTAFGNNFKDDFEPTFGDKRVKLHSRDAKLLSLSLDMYSGSGFCSKKDYLYGRFDLQMKLVGGNSAGSVTTFYLSSTTDVVEGDSHDEIDFEFLGNATGEPYTVHTNVFGQGKGGREQQFKLWFDPTKNFHTYSIVWNPNRIIFLVDNNPIRIYKNLENMGIPFPKNQPMKIYSSLWNADQWATQGGAVKADWSKAPFTAYIRNPVIDACEGPNAGSCATATTTAASTDSSASTNGKQTRRAWRDHDLSAEERKRLRWAQGYYTVYDYCSDKKRFPQGVPTECRHNRV